jgi:prepilin-type N-terminal cleavage/methylation domain-containing protein
MAKKAFTLIELLVVVAIIAVLIAILLPALNAARDAAKAAACLSNQRQIGIAIMTYANQFDGYIVPSKPSAGNHESPLWFQLLRDSNLIVYSSTDTGVLHCPADSQGLDFYSYSANLYTMGQIYSKTCQSPPYDELWKVRKLDSFTRSPGNVFLIADQRCGWRIGSWYEAEAAGAFWWSGSVEYMGLGGLGFNWKRHSRNVRITGTELIQGRSGLLLGDGHAQMFGASFPTYFPNTDVYFPSPGYPYPYLEPNE